METAQTTNVINPEGKIVSYPTADVPEALAKYGYKIPSAQELSDHFDAQDYGEGAGNQIAAGAAGLARGVTLGLSDPLLTGTGAVAPETLSKLRKYNPTTSALSEVAGFALPALMSDGAAAFTPAGALAKLGGVVTEKAATALGAQGAKTLGSQIAKQAIARGAGSAVEGTFWGGGTALSESALGDTDLTAEHLLSNVGYGALTGAILGVPFGAVEGTLAARLSKAHPEQGAIEKAAMSDQIAADAGGPSPGAPGAPEMMTPEARSALQPDSLSDIAEKVKGADFQGGVEVPSRDTLLAASNRVPMEFPPNKLQVESLSSPQVRDKYKAFLETQGEDAKNLLAYEALQKREATGLLNKSVNEVSPSGIAQADPVKSGNAVIKVVTDQYQAEKNELAPLFKKFDKLAVDVRANPQDIGARLDAIFPKVDEHLQMTDDGLKLAKWNSGMPFSKNVHGGISELLETIQKPDLTIAKLRNARDALSDRIDPMNPGRDAHDLGQVKKTLMEYIEGKIQAVDPSLEVRDTFKRYAINEEKRQAMQKVFGGSFKEGVPFGKGIVPEKAIDRIFANTNSIQAVRDFLGDSKFKQVLADHLGEQIAKVSDKGSFSSNKFASFLKRNESELSAAFGGSSDKLQRLRDLTDIMRILPDSPSINPSGTAKTLSLMQKVQAIGSAIKDPIKAGGQLVGGTLERVGSHFESRAQKAGIDAILAGSKVPDSAAARVANYTGLKHLENMAKSGAAKITASARAFLEGGTIQALARKASIPLGFEAFNHSDALATNGNKKPGDKKDDRYASYQNTLDHLSATVSNPSALADRVASNATPLQTIAPKTAQAAILKSIQAAQFLYERAPKNPTGTTASFVKPQVPWRPTDTALSRFERTARAVKDPLSVMDDLKHGTVSAESVEVLSTLYPKLYAKMTGELTQAVSNHKEPLTLSQRVTLAKFLKSPVDPMTDPSMIAKLQQNYMPQAQGSNPGAKPRMAGIDKLGAPGRAASVSEQANQGVST